MLKKFLGDLAKSAFETTTTTVKSTARSKTTTTYPTPMPKGVKPPKAPSPEDTVWTLMIYYEEATYVGRSFSTPSAAETALMDVQSAINAVYAVMRDDLIQKIEDREAKVRNSKQWRELVSRYPLAFGEIMPRLRPRSIMRSGREIILEVVPVPYG